MRPVHGYVWALIFRSVAYDDVESVAYDDVEHVSFTRMFLNNPRAFLRRLYDD